MKLPKLRHFLPKPGQLLGCEARPFWLGGIVCVLLPLIGQFV
jgi:hypothetical protein